MLSRCDKSSGRIIDMELVPHLDSVSIRGFRAFRELNVAGIADVNLVVGGNNLGKTCFLEALNLYFHQGNRTRSGNCCSHARNFPCDECAFSQPIGAIFLSPTSRFFGRPALDAKPFFTIGPANSSASMLSISFCWLQETLEEEGGGHFSEQSKPRRQIYPKRYRDWRLRLAIIDRCSLWINSIAS